jgi:glycosyltransferase involved in cell wall biosynthesis
MKADLHEVAVVIPVYNESSSIVKTIQEIRQYIPNAYIIVVDNGSTDNTFTLANTEGVLVINEPQQGKGYAVRKGFGEIPAICHTVVMIDGDDTYGCEGLVESIKLVEFHGYDMVVGNRISNQDLAADRKPVYRRSHVLGNVLLTKISNLLHPAPIKDALSGYRVMSRKFVKSFPGGASGFEIETELNAHSFLISAAVTNLNVSYRGRGENSASKLRTYSDGFKILRTNFALFRHNRPQLAFSIFALPWLLIGITTTIAVGLRFLETGLVLQFPTLIAGMASLTVSALLFTSGIILERIKLARVDQSRFFYNSRA